jgi:hypothetical protein
MNIVSTVSSQSGYKEFGLTVTMDLPIEKQQKI